MITASHNPPEYNGVKLWNPSGLSFVGDQRTRVEEHLSRETFKSSTWENVGQANADEDAVSEHAQAILSKVSGATIRVVVDCGGGATSEIAPLVLERMGCDVIRLNCVADGHFHSRASEPSEENLTDLKKAVRQRKADLGVAHDGDGDRMVAVDEKGNYAGGDALLPVFAKELVRSSMVVPLSGSMVLDDILPNVEIWRTKVGDVYVGEEIDRRGADFGGEPSGTWIFPEHFLCPDGVFAAAKLVELVSRRSLSELIGSIPRYPMFNEALSYDRSKRLEILARLEEEVKSTECQSIDTTDGWRLSFGDGWALVRPSGTEPKIRITAEARDDHRAKEIYNSMISLIRKVIS